MPSRLDRLNPDARPEPRLSRSAKGQAGVHLTSEREASPRAAILAGPSRDTATGRDELRAGERMSVVSSAGDERAEGRGLLLKAAGAAIFLLAAFGAVTLLHGFAGL